MNIYDIGYGFLATVCIIAGYGFAAWYELHKTKVKPRITICAKCKYAVKTRWWHAQIQRTRCQTPSDTFVTNFITGKKEYPKYNCERHNSQGTCPYYKKVWWRR